MQSLSFNSAEYRYGFQRQEKDDEIKGEGLSINYKFRMHDPRIGRFFSVDPLSSKYPFYSPHAFSGNRVIDAVELEGLEPIIKNGQLSGYNVQEEQRPTQIATDINNPETQLEYRYGLDNDVDWNSIVANNWNYFKDGNYEVSFMRMDDKGYNKLNLNTEDYLDLSFTNLDVNLTISNANESDFPSKV